MHAPAVLVALVLILAPLGEGRRPRGLVAEGFQPRGGEALEEIVAAFEQGRAHRSSFTSYPEVELQAKVVAAVEAGQPPDFAFGLELPYYIAQWAFDNRLVDLTDTVGAFSDMFDPDALERGVAQRKDRAEGPLRAADWSFD